MPQRNDAYFSRSWALLTRDHGWVKPLLLLAAASFVPIVGALGVLGYALEWARLTAWGVDSSPKQKNIGVGECIKSGWRGLLAGIGYVLAAALINNVISSLFGTGTIVSVIELAISTLSTVVFMLAALRATIYQSAIAGYQLDRMWEMVKRDWEGLVKVMLITLLISLVIGLALGLLVVFALIPLFLRLGLSLANMGIDPMAVGYYDEHTIQIIFFEFLDAMVSIAPLFALIAFIGAIGTTFASLIGQTAVALWVRQFNVPAWGASGDPLPMTAGLPEASYAPQQLQQGYQQEYAQPNPYAAPLSDQQQPEQQDQQYVVPYAQPYAEQYIEPYAEPQQYYQQVQQPYRPYQQPMEYTPVYQDSQPSEQFQPVEQMPQEDVSLALDKDISDTAQEIGKEPEPTCEAVEVIASEDLVDEEEATEHQQEVTDLQPGADEEHLEQEIESDESVQLQPEPVETEPIVPTAEEEPIAQSVIIEPIQLDDEQETPEE